VLLRACDLVPADTRLFDGRLNADQSALTGESLPIEAEPGATAFAGSVVVKDGEATGKVTARDAAAHHGHRGPGGPCNQGVGSRIAAVTSSVP